MAVCARNFVYYASIMLNAFNVHYAQNYAGIIGASLSGIHAGVTQAHEKCATMKIKERKNDCHVKIVLMTGRTLYCCIINPT